MTLPPWTLESLAHEWGDAYLLSYCRDRWVALRRDERYFIVADTLDELETAIRADYRKLPVPRAFDPPGADAYLGSSDSGAWWGDEDEEWDGDNCRIYDRHEAEQTALDLPTSLVLVKLRRFFPTWDVTYSAELKTWIARSSRGSFCEPSILLVWVALARRRID